MLAYIFWTDNPYDVRRDERMNEIDFDKADLKLPLIEFETQLNNEDLDSSGFWVYFA
jgi:hypothetical protein